MQPQADHGEQTYTGRGRLGASGDHHRRRQRHRPGRRHRVRPRGRRRPDLLPERGPGRDGDRRCGGAGRPPAWRSPATSATRATARRSSGGRSRRSAASTCWSTTPPSRRAREHRGDHRRGARAHLPDQHLRDVLPVPGGAAADAGRPRSSTSPRSRPRSRAPTAGLRRHQGRDRHLHQRARAGGVERGHPRQRRRAGAGVDAADPVELPPEKTARVRQDTPMGRPAQPAELAPAFVFLASNESSYITGEVIGVTGGKPLH